LSAICARGAQPVLVSRARLGPQLLEYRGAIRVEVLDGQHRDVAVLRVNQRLGTPA
jgi:hypothetical protein